MSKKEKKNVCPFCFHEAESWENERVEGTAVRLCPWCKSVVPPEYDECDEVFPIVVVGPTRAGKTHFLTVLAHELAEVGLWRDYWGVELVIRQGVGGEDEMKVMTQPDQFVSFRKTLYALDRKEDAAGLLQGTQRDAEGAKCALVLSVKYEGGPNRLKEPGKPKKVLVTFSDTAGETFKEDDWSDAPKRYPVLNGHAKAIIAVLDPLELKALRAEAKTDLRGKYVDYGIAPDDETKMPTVRTSAVLSIPGLRKQMKKMPLAVCLTKTDALGALGKLNEESDLLLQSQGGLTDDDDSWGTAGRLSILALKEVSEKTKEFIIQQDGGNEIIKAADKYTYNCFFAVDALGRSFHDGRLADLPQPRRILDPLLWILWQYRLCGGR